MRAGIRFRFSEKNEVELSVEDLRACKDPDLDRLAEADRSSSSSLWVEGDDNGWLTPSEVERAVGIHVTITGGYYHLLDEALHRRAEVIPASDVAALMLKGRSGPIKKRVAQPPAPPLPIDPIRKPDRYDPKAFPQACSPALLRDLEQRLERAISIKPGYSPVYRGFSLVEYGGPEMIRYLMGDWRNLIASHAFTKRLQARLESGDEFHAALRETAEDISTEVVDQIRSKGYTQYVIDQSRATQIAIPIRDKNATGMASYPISPLDAPMRVPTSFGYAYTGYLGLIHDRVVDPTQAMIMVEVDQKIPPGFGRSEYHIPSHIPPAGVRRFFLGFSNWYNAHEYLKTPDQKSDWFEFQILARDKEGRPTEFEITPIEVSYPSGDEFWKRSGASWRSRQADTNTARVFEQRHPILATTLAEIRRQVG